MAELKLTALRALSKVFLSRFQPLSSCLGNTFHFLNFSVVLFLSVWTASAFFPHIQSFQEDFIILLSISLHIFLLCLVPDDSNDRSLLPSVWLAVTVTQVRGLTVTLSFLELDLWVFLEVWVQAALLQGKAVFASARCLEGPPA